MWYWEFNAGSYYTTCFEVEITGDAGGDDDGDDDDDDSSDDSGGSTSFDDYIIQIPISYFGALYDEDTLTTGANNIVLDDDSISYSFVVVGDASVETGNLMYVKCQMFLFFFLFVYFFFFCKYVYFFFFFVNMFFLFLENGMQQYRQIQIHQVQYLMKHMIIQVIQKEIPNYVMKLQKHLDQVLVQLNQVKL